MGYDTKRIRVPDLREAGLCLGLFCGGGGIRGDGLCGYNSRSDIFGSKLPGSPKKTRTDEVGAGGEKLSGRGGGGAPQGLRAGPEPQSSSLSDASTLNNVIVDAGSN